MLLLFMQNLFTPIEVTKNTHNSYPLEELRRYQLELYEITQPRIQSLADQRKRLLTWFRRLTSLERRQTATLNSPEIVALLGRLYEDWLVAQQPTNYRLSLREDKFFATPERSYRDYRRLERVISMDIQQLLEQVLLVSRTQLYEAFTLSDVLLREPQRLFDLVDELQGGVVDAFPEFHPQQLETGQVSFELQAKNESKLLGVWVGTLVVKQIALHFHLGGSKLEVACDLHRTQERQYSLFWSEASEEGKMKLLESAFRKSDRDILTDYSRSVEVAFQWLPRVYSQPINQLILQQWAKCPPKELLSELTYIPLRQAFSISNMYRMDIILEIESVLSQKTIPKPKKKNKKKKKREEVRLNKKESVQETKPESVQSQSELEEQKKMRSNESNPVIKSEHRQETNRSTCKSQPNLQSLLVEKAKVDQVQEETVSDKRETVQVQLRISKQQRENQQLLKEKEKKERLEKDEQERNVLVALQTLYKRVKEDTRNRCRKLIFNRLIYLLGKIGLSCKAYGSFANQLSLPQSDLDISVDSTVLGFFPLQYLTPRNQVILALQYIASLLKPFPWTANFVLLDTAKVPLLTFTADASVYFEIGSQEKSKLKLNSKKLDANRSVVQVDLTIQPFANTPELPHCGLQSSESLRAWLTTYPLLDKAIILLKILLRKAGLHKTFEGGIGSYTIALLLIAFFRSQEEQSTNIFQVLSSFTSFLNLATYQRWLLDPEGQTPVIKESHPQGPILKHPYDGHNMLAKCLKLESAVDAIGEWKRLTNDI